MKITSLLFICLIFATSVAQEIKAPYISSETLQFGEANSHLPDGMIKKIQEARKLAARQQNEMLLDSTVSFRYTDGIDSVKNTKTTYEWDGIDFSITTYKWSISLEQWLLQFKTEYDFDDNFNLLSFRTYNWNAEESNWADDMVTTFTYYPDGLQKTHTRIQWDSYVGAWLNQSKDSTNYDNQKIVSIYTWDGNLDEWIPSTKSEVFYNADGTTNSTFKYSWLFTQNSWVNLEKKEFFYDETGTLESMHQYFWDNQWVYNIKEEYNFDSQGQLTENIIFQHENDEWVNYQKFTFTYDPNGYFDTYVAYTWNNEMNEWKNSIMFEYGYDSEGTLLTSIFYIWDETLNEWVAFTKEEDFMDEEGYKLAHVTYVWGYNYTEWTVSDKTFYFYSLLTNITIPEADKVTIYPNPVDNVLQIERENASEQTYNILSVTGKRIQSFRLTGKRGSINLSHLPGGIYFLQYAENGKLISKKIIKR